MVLRLSGVVLPKRSGRRKIFDNILGLEELARGLEQIGTMTSAIID